MRKSPSGEGKVTIIEEPVVRTSSGDQRVLRRTTSENALKDKILVKSPSGDVVPAASFASSEKPPTTSRSKISPKRKGDGSMLKASRDSTIASFSVVFSSPTAARQSPTGSKIVSSLPAAQSTGFGRERPVLQKSPSMITRFLASSTSRSATPMRSADGANSPKSLVSRVSSNLSVASDIVEPIAPPSPPPPLSLIHLAKEMDELTALRSQVRLLQNMLLLERKQHQTTTTTSDRSTSPNMGTGRGKRFTIETSPLIVASTSGGGEMIQNFESSRVFGEPLEIIFSKGIPKFVSTIAAYLANGVCNEKSPQSLRPTEADGQLILLLRTAIDAGEDVDIVTLKPEPGAVAGLLKTFVSALPTPLILKDAELALISAFEEISDKDMRATCVLTILNTQVSIYAKDLLLPLLDCCANLKRICSASSGKIGRFFGPSIFGYKREKSSGKKVAKLFASLLDDYALLNTLKRSMLFKLQDDGVVRLSAASLLCISRKLLLANSETTQWSEDTVELILQTYPAFCKSKHLLQALVTCVYDTSPSFVTPTEQLSPWQLKVRTRFFAILDLWAQKFPFADRNDEMRKVNRYIFNRAPEPSREVLSQFLFKQRLVPKRTASTTAAPFPGIKVHTTDDSLVLLTQDPIAIAEELTLIEAELFLAVPAWQLIGRNSSQQKLSELVARYNLLSNWTLSEILQADPLDRVPTLEALIEIASELRRLNNFSSSFAIFGGIGMLATSRFKLIHNKLSKNHQRQYVRLEELFSLRHNNKTLRDAQKQAQGPIVPHFALFTKYLSAVDEIQPTFLAEDLLNIDKLRRQNIILTEIQWYQKRSAAYDLPSNLSMRNMLKELRCLSSEQLAAKNI